MEIFVFAAAVFVGMVYLLRRGRATGSGPDEYVPGSQGVLPGDDEANLRAGSFPGPGGPISGTGGNGMSSGS